MLAIPIERFVLFCLCFTGTASAIGLDNQSFIGFDPLFVGVVLRGHRNCIVAIDFQDILASHCEGVDSSHIHFMTFDILLRKVTVMQILNALGHLRLRRAWSRSSVVVNFHSLLGLRVYFHLEFVKFLEIIGVINFRTFPRRRTLD